MGPLGMTKTEREQFLARAAQSLTACNRAEPAEPGSEGSAPSRSRWPGMTPS